MTNLSSDENETENLPNCTELAKLNTRSDTETEGQDDSKHHFSNRPPSSCIKAKAGLEPEILMARNQSTLHKATPASNYNLS